MTPGESLPLERNVPHVRDYLRVLGERKPVVITCFGLVVAATALFTFLEHPLYRATATIQIERTAPEALNFGQLTGSDYYEYQDFYQTQYKVLQSRTVLRIAAQKLDLPNRPTYAQRKGTPIGRLIAWGANLFSGGAGATGPPDTWLAPTNFMAQRLTVEPVRNSKLVRLTFEDRDRQLSADAANAVADAYETFNTTTRYTTSDQAREFLTDQVGRLQSEIAKEEQELQDEGKQKEILSLSDSTQNIAEKALGDMNARYIEARGRLAVAQARYEAVANGDPDSLPEVLQSQLITDLKMQYADIERRYNQAAERFKADWPPLQQMQEELDGAANRLEVETDTIARQVRSVAKAEYAKVRDEVENLGRQVDAQKIEVQRVAGNAIGYAGLKADIETKRKILNDLLTRQSETDTTSRLKGGPASNMRIVDRAEIPRAPFKPNKPLNLALSVLFGLLLGAGAALLLNYADNTVKTEQDIQRHAGVPALGFIPLYQTLHVVVTSCEPLDGKSTVITNLAIALTQIGRRVVIVDADLRRPRVHKVFGITNEIGLSSFLSGNAPVEEVVRDSGVPNLQVVTSGPVPPNPSELLASKALEAFMESLETVGPFDHVFFDSPPLLQMADAVLLATCMDATILVAREGRTIHQSLSSGVKRLRQSRARILGAVLNAVVERFGNYYYYRYHRDEPGESKPRSSESRARRRHRTRA